MNPKSLNAAIFFVAAHAREFQREVDGPLVDIVLAMLRSMRCMNTASFVGSRIHPNALTAMNGVPFDDLVAQVNRVLMAIENGDLTTDNTYGMFADFYHPFIDAPVYGTVVE